MSMYSKLRHERFATNVPISSLEKAGNQNSCIIWYVLYRLEIKCVDYGRSMNPNSCGFSLFISFVYVTQVYFISSLEAYN